MKNQKFILNTKTMTYMAIFAALQIVLEYLTQFTPQMPQGGNVAFSLVVLMLCSYLMTPVYGLIVSLVCVGLHFVLGFATFYGALSVIFDYLLPMAIVGLVGLIPLVKINKIELPVGIIIVMVLKTICHLIAGWYAFATPLPANLGYNLPYNIATMVVCFILFMILYPRLKNTIKI
ncbi:energy-coupled thiamine transporter ThiT [uncultured Thomasclavelia sp.]|uniref:energy-coupled thiamine transporter ThiT n=1 Tax=uncultured Thomasclavelia sp. TaxID=3025759 RepID=UPI0025FBDBE4|nr:energy-coupled thiamine transporter ThiT [uncultured Thomasclavelia sp.]